MPVNIREDRIRSRIEGIAVFLNKNGRMPSFSEIGVIAGLHSKNAVFKLVNSNVDYAFVFGRLK